MKSLHLQILFGLICLATLSSTAIDNPHFWRAINFLPQFYEPRLAKSGLTSFDLFAAYGKTSTSRNAQGQTVPLLDLNGPENIQPLAFGLPLDLSNPVDITLQNLSLLGCACNFGQLSFGGKFKLTELNFCFSQNFVCGFFAQVHFPYRRMILKELGFCDLTQDNPEVTPNRSDPTWQTFLNLFPTFLTRYGLTLTDPCSTNCSTTKTGIGDTTVLLGWTFNYEETESLDYVDFTIRTGVLIPTGQKADPALLFDLPNGYNGHIGIPASMSFALGYFEWLTIGTHIGGMAFVHKTECTRFHTSPLQNGYIKLVPGSASVHEGTIWELAAYLKADHFAGGATFLAGYNFATQGRTTVKPCDQTIVNTETANSDSTLAGWKMHTVNFMFEYDFSSPEHCIGPRFGIIYNIQVGGTRIFKTNMAGGFIGFDFVLDF